MQHVYNTTSCALSEKENTIAIVHTLCCILSQLKDKEQKTAEAVDKKAEKAKKAAATAKGAEDASNSDTAEAKLKKKKGCCGKAPKTARDSDIDAGMVTVDAVIETPEIESPAEQRMREQLVRESMERVATAHVATTVAKSTADAYLEQRRLSVEASALLKTSFRASKR